jgi:hypothetical protein
MRLRPGSPLEVSKVCSATYDDEGQPTPLIGRTLFVGLNLFQSGFTNWCPMMAILRKAGLPAR